MTVLVVHVRALIVGVGLLVEEGGGSGEGGEKVEVWRGDMVAGFMGEGRGCTVF